MELLRRLIKWYYRKKGYEIVLKKYRFFKNRYPQSIVLPHATFSPWMGDPEFRDIYNQIKDNTLVDIYRCFELWSLVEQVSGLDGNYLEVGVWKGGTGAIIAKRAALIDPSSKVFLCDTFEGVVKAGEMDSRYEGGEHADTSQELVMELVKEKLGLRNTEILQGSFPDETGSVVAQETFKFCHIDVDVYQGAKEISEWVWPRLVPGGIVVFDDYGFGGTDGVTEFVEEVRTLKDRLVFHNLNGHGILVKLG